MDAFFILSKTSFGKLPDKVKNVILKKNHIFTKGYDYTNLPEVKEKVVIGIGGGTAIDMTKYIAKNANKKCVAIPSMLSTNVFATNKVASFNSSGKKTVDGVLPIVYLDTDYLKKSKKENTYGLVDVFSIFNALRDWKLANDLDQLPILDDIFTRAENLLEKSLEINVDDIDELFEIIKESGYITNDYGSGRPESGSEHIFANTLETIYKNDYDIVIPHGIAVAIGIFVMTFFFDNFFAKYTDDKTKVVLDAIKKLVIDDINSFNLSFEYIMKVLKSSKVRPDKYTIFNVLPSFKEEDLKFWLEKAGMQFKRK